MVRKLFHFIFFFIFLSFFFILLLFFFKFAFLSFSLCSIIQVEGKFKFNNSFSPLLDYYALLHCNLLHTQCKLAPLKDSISVSAGPIQICDGLTSGTLFPNILQTAQCECDQKGKKPKTFTFNFVRTNLTQVRNRFEMIFQKKWGVTLFIEIIALYWITRNPLAIKSLENIIHDSFFIIGSLPLKSLTRITIIGANSIWHKWIVATMDTCCDISADPKVGPIFSKFTFQFGGWVRIVIFFLFFLQLFLNISFFICYCRWSCECSKYFGQKQMEVEKDC